MNTSEIISNTQFSLKVLTLAAPIYSAHINDIFKERKSKVPFPEYGSPKEIFIKNVFERVATLNSYSDELESLLVFFDIDLQSISSIYSDKIDPESYLKYHYDNFIIRLATSLDLCGKLGNFIFNLGINERYCYAHSFVKRLSETASAKILQDASDYLEHYVQQRNAKVHASKSENNVFEKVVYWNEMGRLIKNDEMATDALLATLTKEQIRDEIDQMREIIDKTVGYIAEFLETMSSQFDDRLGVL
ncbi:Cthe_2314 family HEPN domain-containing protein [Chitinophaga sancti]|uniref:Cthe_2314 family HEPN domain-containing protein n=1 Tax=Chitinophaga sancti TaxID=1004 RepID=UPI002A754BFC|nr:Cthe_2314 family HEPN domain-containing protein [Chitinophaga sancti]WPQ61266.1 Cthe_2314 family HEPN domain-containing protein [Chitinophaga sancti]